MVSQRTPKREASALDDVGNPNAPPGSEPWARWMLVLAKMRRHDLERDVTELQAVFKKMVKHSAWKALGFLSFGCLCWAELGLDQDDVDLIRRAKSGQALGSVLAYQLLKRVWRQVTPDVRERFMAEHKTK